MRGFADGHNSRPSIARDIRHNRVAVDILLNGDPRQALDCAAEHAFDGVVAFKLQCVGVRHTERSRRLPHARWTRAFEQWLDDLDDKKAVATVLARLARVRQGNLGDCRSVGAGVSELRVDYGPGYRVYFGQDGRTLVVLLGGGDKRTQDRDIRLANRYWREYKAR